MDVGDIRKNVRDVLGDLPEGVDLVAAAKTRTPSQVLAAVEAGVGIIGENYVQEAQAVRKVLGENVKWHFIGHLQKNKVKKAVMIFDLIETLDSALLAREIDKRSRAVGKIMPVLIEINSARESQKFGVLPEDVPGLIESISEFENLKVMGLMTMGPFSGDPEEARPYFSETKKIFDHMKSLKAGRYEMKYLSMGMSNSYLIAVEEGANMVRLGTRIFGERG